MLYLRTCSLDQPVQLATNGLIQTRFDGRVGWWACGMPRQHFRRIGTPPSKAIDQGLTLHLDIARQLLDQSFLTPYTHQPGTGREELSTGKEKGKEGPAARIARFITSRP